MGDAGTPTHNDVRVQPVVHGGAVRLGLPLIEQGHGVCSHDSRVLAEGREIVGFPGCFGYIVKPDDGQVFRNPQICVPPHMIDKTKGNQIIDAEYGLRVFAAGKKLPRRLCPPA